ncbi:MAG: CD225/dispanin family protein [Verrucomicrobiales bacterium]
MSAEWYYAVGGQQSGPVSQEALAGKLRGGEIAADSLIWKKGMPDWLPATQVTEFASLSAPVAPPSGSDPYQSTPHQPPATGAAPPNYLWQSIVCTIFCCWPLGIPAIVYAAKVEGLHSRGDAAGALDASKKAKTWCWVSFGCGLAFILIYVGLVMAGGMAGEFSGEF